MSCSTITVRMVWTQPDISLSKYVEALVETPFISPVGFGDIVLSWEVGSGVYDGYGV